MRLQQLFESMSPVVYHATTFESGLHILESNRLRSGTGYISFSRSITGSYPLENKIVGIIFEVDGQRLNRKYGGKPVGTEDYDLGDNVSYSGKRNKQLEDRLLTKTVDNFADYVVRAHIFIPREYLEAQTADEFDNPYEPNLKVLPQIITLLDTHNIPYRVATTEKDLFNKRVDDRAALEDMLTPHDEREVFIVTLGRWEDTDDDDYDPADDFRDPDRTKKFKIKGVGPAEVESRVEHLLHRKKSQWVLIDVDWAEDT